MRWKIPIELGKQALLTSLKKNLPKLKEALSRESDQTKEMLGIYQRFLLGEASEQEMDRANEQFKDLLKTLGLGVLVVLPGSPITIPAVVKFARRYGIEVLPDSFRDMDKS